MRNIVLHQNERVGQWVAQRIGQDCPWGDFQSIGIERDGVLVGGAVIEGYVKDARCIIHCAGEGKTWMNREFLFVVFDYVFRQLGCKVVLSPVRSDNAECIKFISHLGFTHFTIPEGSGDCDLLVFTMPRRMCRWLDIKRGNVCAST